MTGMGKDGATELANMRKEGAWTLGQDEDSCIVYGMPKVAWELGAVQKQVTLDNMADEIIHSLGFIKRLGQNRNRGLGRCTITVEEKGGDK